MNRPARVFISTSSFASWDDQPLRLLRDAGLDVEVNPFGRKLTSDECLRLYRDIDGLIAGTEDLNAEILHSATNLKVISRCGAGTDSVDKKAAEERDIKVFATAPPTQAVAELTLGLILALLRWISGQDRLVRSGVWQKQMGCLLAGKTLGILGLGRIGKRVVELTMAFELRYVAWDIDPDQRFAAEHGVLLVELSELLRSADIVAVHLPYTPRLHGVIGESELALMKSDAVLINTARGGLVDEAALHKALKERRIAGAALDVFEHEPYTGHLRELENVILTPHIGSYAREARVEMEIEATRHLIEGLGSA